jgi:hypothetical protein
MLEGGTTFEILPIAHAVGAKFTMQGEQPLIDFALGDWSESLGRLAGPHDNRHVTSTRIVPELAR